MSSYGNITLLAQTTSTTAKTFTIENIDNFRYILVIRNQAGVPAIVPTIIFKTLSQLMAEHSGNSFTASYGAIAKYISNTSVQLYVIKEGTAVLYGIK